MCTEKRGIKKHWREITRISFSLELITANLAHFYSREPPPFKKHKQIDIKFTNINKHYLNLNIMRINYHPLLIWSDQIV